MLSYHYAAHLQRSASLHHLHVIVSLRLSPSEERLASSPCYRITTPLTFRGVPHLITSTLSYHYAFRPQRSASPHLHVIVSLRRSPSEERLTSSPPRYRITTPFALRGAPRLITMLSYHYAAHLQRSASPHHLHVIVSLRLSPSEERLASSPCYRITTPFTFRGVPRLITATSMFLLPDCTTSRSARTASLTVP